MNKEKVEEFESRRERLHSLKSQFNRDSDDFEEYIYERRRRILDMESIYKPDPIIMKILDRRKLLFRKMEQNLYDCKEEYEKYLDKEYSDLEDEIYEYNQQEIDEGEEQ